MEQEIQTELTMNNNNLYMCWNHESVHLYHNTNYIYNVHVLLLQEKYLILEIKGVL